jgi:hypothetical protein
MFRSAVSRGPVLRRASCSASRSFAGGFSLTDMESKNILDLPRLTVPELDDTMERYLASVGPLTTPDQFAEHEKLVRDFQSSAGPVLQEKVGLLVSVVDR